VKTFVQQKSPHLSSYTARYEGMTTVAVASEEFDRPYPASPAAYPPAISHRRLYRDEFPLGDLEQFVVTIVGGAFPAASRN